MLIDVAGLLPPINPNPTIAHGKPDCLNKDESHAIWHVVHFPVSLFATYTTIRQLTSRYEPNLVTML